MYLVFLMPCLEARRIFFLAQCSEISWWWAWWSLLSFMDPKAVLGFRGSFLHFSFLFRIPITIPPFPSLLPFRKGLSGLGVATELQYSRTKESWGMQRDTPIHRLSHAAHEKHPAEEKIRKKQPSHTHISQPMMIIAGLRMGNWENPRDGKSLQS